MDNTYIAQYSNDIQLNIHKNICKYIYKKKNIRPKNHISS